MSGDGAQGVSPNSPSNSPPYNYDSDVEETQETCSNVEPEPVSSPARKASPPSSPGWNVSPCTSPRNASPSTSPRNASPSTSPRNVSPSTSPRLDASPPSSPVRKKFKRDIYAAYKNDSSIPVPRSTLQRWAKTQTGSDSADSGSETSVADDAPPPSPPQQRNFEEEPRVDEQLSTCTPPHEDSEDNQESSDSDSSADRVGDSELGSDTSHNVSIMSLAVESDHDLGGDVSDSDREVDLTDEDMLYNGSKKRVDEAVLEFFELHIENRASKTHLQGLLKFFLSCLPLDHNFPRSLHFLYKYVQNLAPPIKEVRHYYCIPGRHEVRAGDVNCNVCGSEVFRYFFELPLECQIRFLFEQRGLAEVMKSYAESRNLDQDVICDVVDGSEYKRVWNGVIATGKITLILNTDGVQLHEDSSSRFWPLMFTIMEVPPRLRTSFIVVWGAWFDTELKPKMNTFLKPFVTSLENIFEQGGITWADPQSGEVHKTQVFAPLVVADAPARAAVQGIQEHQSKYACNTCEQKTVKLPPEPVLPGEKRKRRKRRFVFRERTARMRKHERMLQQGLYVEDSNVESKKGVNTLPVIHSVPRLDLSTCVVAEYMHSVLKGVVSHFSVLWFNTKGNWYIGGYSGEISAFLIDQIHPPDFVTRLPRDVSTISGWKANELRSWLLYYSLIVISQFMPDKYVQHWMLFVCAVYILLQERISETELDTAEVLIRLFVRDIGKLYGDKHYVYNVHQMLHLTEYVRRWGPLWATSAFSFESFNAFLANMIHGTKNQGQELMNQVKLAQGVQLLRNRVNNARNILDQNFAKVLGSNLCLHLSHDQQELITNLKFKDPVQFYGRVCIGRKYYSSKQHDFKLKRHNSFVEVNYEGKKKVGQIIFFCKSGLTVMCVISLFKIVHSKGFYHKETTYPVRHIKPVEDSGILIICDVNCIVQKLIKVGSYLCVRPNSIEVNL